MENIVHTGHCILNGAQVTDVADEESEFVFVFGKLVAHDELLVFITGVDDNLFRVVMFEDVLDKVISKGSGSAGDEDGFVVEHMLCIVYVVGGC